MKKSPPIPDSRIYEVIADGAHLTGEISDALERSRSSLYKRLRRMADAGKIRYVDQSIFQCSGYYLPGQHLTRRTTGPIIVLDAIAAGCHTWKSIRDLTGCYSITHHVNALIRVGLIHRTGPRNCADQRLYLSENRQPAKKAPAPPRRPQPAPITESPRAWYHEGHEAAVQAAGEARRARLTRLFGH